MNDRFTQASMELVDNNPYVCTTCVETFGHPAIGRIGDEPGIRGGYDMTAHGADCILDCDPVPFGD